MQSRIIIPIRLIEIKSRFKFRGIREGLKDVVFGLSLKLKLSEGIKHKFRVAQSPLTLSPPNFDLIWIIDI